MLKSGGKYIYILIKLFFIDVLQVDTIEQKSSKFNDRTSHISANISFGSKKGTSIKKFHTGPLDDESPIRKTKSLGLTVKEALAKSMSKMKNPNHSPCLHPESP